jgi:AbrB family looped-hinge helix DNA binding protein
MKEALSSVSPKGQITLPAEIRKVLGLKPTDRVAVWLEDGQVRIRPVGSLQHYFQRVPALDPGRSWKEIEAIAHDEHAQHVAREGLE